MAFLESSSNDVGGYSKKSSNLHSAQSSNQETFPSTNISTLIVELYLKTNFGYSALGLRSSSTEISSSTHYNNYGICSWKEPDNNSYCFDDISNKMYVSHSMGDNPRRVFVFHNWQNGQMSIYPAHLSYGPKSASSPFVSTAYIGTSNGLMNNWVTHTDGDGNIYKSITVDSNSKFIGTTLSVVKGKKYTFNMHTVSEANFDGIIISDTSMTEPVGSIGTAGIARCSGVNITSEYTYTPTSDGTIYIYFRTDSSDLSNSHQAIDATDSTGSTIITKNFTTGDIEIIVGTTITTTTTTIILDPNDGTISGLKTTSIRYGDNVSNIRVSSLPEKTGCTFKGYYTGSSRNNPGTMYIDSNGRGVSGLTWNIKDSTYTLYALYEYGGNIVLSWYSLNCVYCTSSAASTSTLQAPAQITVGLISSTIAGEFTGSQLNTSASNHLGNLTPVNYKTFTIPSGKASGDYIFEIKYTFTPNDTSVFIKEDTKECEIWIIPTYVVRETMELPSPVPDSLVQKEDIPAGSFTLNENNVSEYFRYSGTIPSTSTLIYNNGKSASSTPQITWSMHQPITFNSLGATITSRGLVTIPDRSSIWMNVKSREHIGPYYSNRTEVIKIISDVLKRDDVGYYSQFSALGINMRDRTNIVRGISKTYNIIISEIDLEHIYSVDLLCKYLYKFYNIGIIESGTNVPPPFISAIYNNTQVYREANEVTNLHISVTKNPIDVGETTTWNTTADFTSGSEGVSVNGSETFSGYDTSIIQIDNT